MKNLSNEELIKRAMFARDKSFLNGDEGDYYARKEKAYKAELLSRLNRLAEAESQISIIKQKYIKERNEHVNDNIYWFNEVYDRQQRLAEAEKQLKERELSSICVYCGTKLISKSTDTKMNDVIEHMAECKKHPVSILLDKLAEIEKWFIQHGEHTLEIWNGYVKLHNEGMFTLAQSDNLTKEKRK